MDISRRDLLKAGLTVAAGGLLMPRVAGALSRPLGPTSLFETSRASRLSPGTLLAHGDLHNHSLHSDGDGDPTLAFASMSSAGLDVAALTDHSTLSWGLAQSACAGNKDCQSVAGIDDASWAAQQLLADGANVDEEFIAMRGFEWSSPTIGHMNVWFSERWIDPLHTGGGGTGEGAAQFAHEEGNFPIEQMAALDAIVRAAPTTGAGMALFYEWLTADPSRPVYGGGADGLAGFNHPGREPGRFSHFRNLGLGPSIRDRVVSLEIFNRREDYIFEGTGSVAQSPLNECLNAGWRVGLAGVTDEHGTDWGHPEGKGRTGLWVTDLTRAGVREAMAARRFFATNQRGLRVDATANGVRMGTPQDHPSGPMTFALDIDRGAEWVGKELMVQVLRSGERLPAVQENRIVVVPSSEQSVITFTTDIDRADGDWVVLRITDPAGQPDGRADATWASFGPAVAYASPFYLA